MAFDPLVIAKGLEDIFLQIRQRATPCRYDGVSVREPIVYLDGTTRDDPQPGETLHAFPEVRSIIDGVKHQALVMLDGGIDPLVLMYPFVNALLAGKLGEYLGSTSKTDHVKVIQTALSNKSKKSESPFVPQNSNSLTELTRKQSLSPRDSTISTSSPGTMGRHTLSTSLPRSSGTDAPSVPGVKPSSAGE